MEQSLSKNEKDEAVYWLLFEIYNEKKIKSSNELLTKRFIQNNFCKHFTPITAQQNFEYGLKWLLENKLIVLEETTNSFDTSIAGDQVVERFFKRVRADLIEYSFLRRSPKYTRNLNYLTELNDPIRTRNHTSEEYVDGVPTLSLKLKVALKNIFTFFAYLSLIKEVSGIDLPTIMEITQKLAEQIPK